MNHITEILFWYLSQKSTMLAAIIVFSIVVVFGSIVLNIRR